MHAHLYQFSISAQERVGGKRYALTSLPSGRYEGHMEKTVKQRAENLCWLLLSVLGTLEAYIAAAYSNMFHTGVEHYQYSTKVRKRVGYSAN
jgi:hypothetical protein